jgi:hypothetical protein
LSFNALASVGLSMFARTPVARPSEAAKRYTFWETNAVLAHF